MSKKDKLLVTIAVIAIVLVAVRVAMPEMIQRYVNGKLDASPDYDGLIGDVDLSLIRSAYSIDDIEIVKTTGNIPVPLFSAPHIDFSIYWSALLDGAIVGEMRLEQPMLNIVDSEDEAQKQTVTDDNWAGLAEELFPLRIDRIEIVDGQLHFRNFDSEPPVDVYLSQMQVVAENLTNSEDLSETMVATVDLTARAMESSDFTLLMQLDPSQDKPTFNIDSKLLGLPMMTIDELVATYAPFDVEAGSVDIVTELAASEGRLDGYVQPIIYDLTVFTWKEDIAEDEDNPLRALWEGLIGFVGELLENQPRDQLATNIPISGDLDNPQTGVLATIANILRNAFIEAYQAEFENSISFGFGDDEPPDDADSEGARGAESAESTADSVPDNDESSGETGNTDNPEN